MTAELWFVYVIVAILVFVFCSAAWHDDRYWDKDKARVCAIIALGAPVWPLTLTVAGTIYLYHLIADLWDYVFKP